MQRLVDLFWDALHPTGVSWIGFYVKSTPGEELILAARRDKPACSPIGMHGACGQSFVSRRGLVVTDVARLGEGYIACDPRDRSEVVIPMLEAAPGGEVESGERAWGVLDADSYDTHSFTARDAEQLHAVLVKSGLTLPRELMVDQV